MTRRLLAVALVAVAAAAAGAPAADARGPITIAQRGFGDRANSYAWGMAWFKGHLYVGTGRNVRCTEAATTDFYFPIGRSYLTNDDPSVHCPRSRYDMNQRAEIWRYTPGTGRWSMVYRSPTVPNPRAPGKRIALDTAYRGMSVHRDARGRKALFISAVSANEYIPELQRRHPPRLLRTFNGMHYHDIATRFVVHKTGEFGDHRPVGYRGMQWWRGHLYILASTALAGDGAVFRVDNPFGRRARFRQVTPPWMYVFELQVFNHRLYVGVGSRQTGYSVYRTGSIGRPYKWTGVLTHGAGRGPVMTGVIAMNVFRGRLYVSAVSWYCDCTSLPTSEIVRINKDDTWQVVVGRPRQTADGRIRRPISGLMDGFENIFVTHVWRMADADGAMYAGTLDWSYLLQVSKDWAGPNSGLLSSLLAGELGFDMWATCDGRDWFPVTRTAFNGDEYDFGVRNIVPSPDGSIYIGTANHAYGTRIIHDTMPACDPLTGPHSRDPGVSHQGARAAVARPSGLLTDRQRNGTVLSWDDAQPATRFQVERAAYTPVSISYKPAFALPDGFPAEDHVPELTPPGTPGSITANVSIRTPFTPIGTTTRSFFVDRTGKAGTRYAYQVVPVTGTGVRGPASNVQIVPDPRPAPTWGQLQQLLPGGPIAKASRAPTAAEVARIARTTGNADAQELARRLARRLKYRDVAGGPVGR